MQLSRSLILEVHLVPRGRAIHFGTTRTSRSPLDMSVHGGEAVMPTSRSKMTPARYPAVRRAPDVTLTDPLCCPRSWLGQRMQSGQLQRREFIAPFLGNSGWRLVGAGCAVAAARHPAYQAPLAGRSRQLLGLLGLLRDGEPWQQYSRDNQSFQHDDCLQSGPARAAHISRLRAISTALLTASSRSSV
jgi:hypothetical protein